jgi:hypothetical protein
MRLTNGLGEKVILKDEKLRQGEPKDHLGRNRIIIKSFKLFYAILAKCP